MSNQYCKVGAVTPITSGSQAVSVLEYMYQNFIEKASEATNIDKNLRDFFNAKAQGIKKTLESLV